MVEIPLTLPIGLKNFPPIFCTATKTVTDIYNAALRCDQPSRPHTLDNSAEAVVISNLLPLYPALAELSRNPYIKRRNTKLTAYVDFSVDEFLVIAEGTTNRYIHVRITLFCILEKVLQLLDPPNASDQNKVMFLKNLDVGYCT